MTTDYRIPLAKRIAKHKPSFRLVDFRLQNEGSILLLHPLSPGAVEWLDENIGQDNGYQPLWPSILIEPRYLRPILEGLDAAGLIVEGQN